MIFFARLCKKIRPRTPLYLVNRNGGKIPLPDSLILLSNQAEHDAKQALFTQRGAYNMLCYIVDFSATCCDKKKERDAKFRLRGR